MNKDLNILDPHIPRYDKLIEITEFGDATVKKYSNGFMEICGRKTVTKTSSGTWGSYHFVDHVFNFPVEFTDIPDVFPAVYGNSGMYFAGLGSVIDQTSKSTKVRALSIQAWTNIDMTFKYRAVGHWK